MIYYLQCISLHVYMNPPHVNFRKLATIHKSQTDNVSLIEFSNSEFKKTIIIFNVYCFNDKLIFDCALFNHYELRGSYKF